MLRSRINAQFAPPKLGQHLLEYILADHYGLAGQITSLSGEREQNLRLATDDMRYVVKVFRQSDGPGAIEFQNRALKHLGEKLPDLALPAVHKTKSGAAIHRVDVEGEGHCELRVLDYLEGQPIEFGDAPTAALASAAGRFVGAVTRELGRMDVAANGCFMAWDVSNGLLGDPELWGLGAADIRAYEQSIRRRYDELLPVLMRQPAHIIYNDAHLENLLRPSADAEKLSGLIDFGDMIHAPVVCDLATLALGFAEAAADPPAMTGAAVAGYHAAYPLSPQEIDLVHEVMIARQVLSVLLLDVKLAEPHLRTDGNIEIRARLMKRLDRLYRIDAAAFKAAIHAAIAAKV